MLQPNRINHASQFCHPQASNANWSLALRRKHVGAKFSEEVARRAIIADVENRRNAGSNVCKARGRAVHRRAANRGAADPNNLRKVAVPLKAAVKVCRSCLAVIHKQADLIVVKLARDDAVNGIHRRTSSNVLAVTTTVGVDVVGVDARLSNRQRCVR